MAQITLGDLAGNFQLKRRNAGLQVEAQRLATEVATGRAADTGARLRGDLGPLAAIETSLARLGAFRTASAEARLAATGQQETLATLDRLAGDIAPSLLSAANAGQAGMLATLAEDAAGRLESALTALNARAGDRALFAGVQTGGPAVADAATLMTALEAAVAGASGAEEAGLRIEAWFADPTGYAATVYRGGAAGAAVAISAEERFALAITATDPAIRDTLKGLATAALIGRPGLPAGADAALARRAGETLVAGKGARADLAAGLGLAEGRIEAAAQRNESERFALELARSQMLDTDGYEAATRLETVETQIETLYAVTARLSRLTLADFLR